jgi:predicted PurR-regulated permease PerM
MKEKDIDDSTIDIKDINKSTIVDSNAIYNTHEEKMMKMLENSQNIVKQIKQMSKEISNDLKFQNKLINDIGVTVNKTDLDLKKNTSKIEQILLKTSTCSLITSAIIQVIVIIFIILL